MPLILNALSWAWSHPIDVAAWVLLAWAVAVVVGSAVLWVLLLRSEQRRERERLNRIMAACGDPWRPTSAPPCAPGPKHERPPRLRHLRQDSAEDTMRLFWYWLTHNASSAHHRVLARYLRRRGWVVFYLEDRARSCEAGCWLKLYEDGERRTR